MSRLAAAAASLLGLLVVGAALSVRDEPAPDLGPPPAAAPVSLMSSCPTKDISEPSVVDISGFAYCPSSRTVTAGVEVVWINLDLAPHTVTYDGPDGRLDSGSMGQGQRWATRFDLPGTYQYYCRFHAGMTGTIVVDASQ